MQMVCSAVGLRESLAKPVAADARGTPRILHQAQGTGQPKLELGQSLLGNIDHVDLEDFHCCALHLQPHEEEKIYITAAVSFNAPAADSCPYSRFGTKIASPNRSDHGGRKQARSHSAAEIAGFFASPAAKKKR